MPVGPGRYDDECTLVRERTGAACAIVIILGGNLLAYLAWTDHLDAQAPR